MKKKMAPILILAYLMLSTQCIYLSDSRLSETIAPALAWSHTITEGQISSAIIDDGLAYYDIRLGGTPIRIEAYDLRAQQVQWAISKTTDTYLLSGDGKLFLLNESENILTAISKEDGTTVWHIPLPAQGYEYEMTFGDGLLFFGVGDLIYAIDATDGRILWQRPLPSSFRINQAWLGNSSVYRDYDALSYYDTLLYVRLWGDVQDQTMECMILAIDAFDGQERWRLTFDIPVPKESPPPMVASRPAFEGRSLFFGDWMGRIYLMDKDTGEIIWQDQSEFPIARPLLQDKRVYLPTRSSLLCLNSETGERLWSMSLSELRNRSPIRAVGDVIFFVADYWGERRTGLIVVNARTGELIDKLEIPLVDKCIGCVTALEVETGRLYMTQQQTIIAIDLLPLPEQ